MRVLKPGGVVVSGTKFSSISGFDPAVFRNKDREVFMGALGKAGFEHVSASEVRLASGWSLLHHSSFHAYSKENIPKRTGGTPPA